MKIGGGAGHMAEPKMKLGGRAGRMAKPKMGGKGSTPKLHVGKGPKVRGAPNVGRTKTTAPKRSAPAAAPAMGGPGPQPPRMMTDGRPGAGTKRGEDQRRARKAACRHEPVDNVKHLQSARLLLAIEGTLRRIVHLPFVVQCSGIGPSGRLAHPKALHHLSIAKAG
jgi:hypothetical protein